MQGHDIIVIGASAGGVEALTRLVAAFRPDLPAAVFIVLHVPAEGTSVLPQILSRSGPLIAEHAQDGAPFIRGRIYIAPPGMHLLVDRDVMRLSNGVKVNGFRPAIDPLFNSAARLHGRRTAGVILSGTLDDGTAGLSAIKANGGATLVQSPEEALYASMPRNAIEAVEVDYVLPVTEIAAQINRLAFDDITEGLIPMHDEIDDEERIRLAKLEQEQGQRLGSPSIYTCPDCGGVLWEMGETSPLHYRCHVGHVYSASTLLSEQSDALESALWTAIRALEERASLSRRLATRMKDLGQPLSEERFNEQADDAHARALEIRSVLLRRTVNASDTFDPSTEARHEERTPVGQNPEPQRPSSTQ